MLAVQETRYTVLNTEEGKEFISGLRTVYEWGGGKVEVEREKDTLTAIIRHVVDTDEIL